MREPVTGSMMAWRASRPPREKKGCTALHALHRALAVQAAQHAAQEGGAIAGENLEHGIIRLPPAHQHRSIGLLVEADHQLRHIRCPAQAQRALVGLPGHEGKKHRGDHQPGGSEKEQRGKTLALLVVVLMLSPESVVQWAGVAARA